MTYAGGGGGGAQETGGANGGTGGSGGGGAGRNSGSGCPGGAAGTANTGGGGGGSCGYGGQNGYGGGSGVVILAYVTADYSGWTITGGTITTSGANTIHTFNSDGTFAATSPAVNAFLPNQAAVAAHGL